MRWVASCFIALHLLAVFAEPFRFFSRSSRGTSPAADVPREWLAPYVEFAYLNHGYFFFAPDPGPSHLIDCQLTFADGERASLRFPDRTAQWPRLLYHRHFMLSENLHQLWVPPVAPDLVAADQSLAQDWQAERNRFLAIRDSMAKHLTARYDAQSVTIDRVEHLLPSDEDVFIEKMRLNDRRLYVTLPDAPLNEIALPAAGSQADQLPSIQPALISPADTETSRQNPSPTEEVLQPAGAAQGIPE